jgi:hypothetical protein
MRKYVAYYFLIHMIPIFLLLVIFDFSWLARGLMTFGVMFSCIFWNELGGELSDLTFVWAAIGLISLFFGSIIIWKELIEKIYLDPLSADFIKLILFIICVVVGCFGIFVEGLFSAEKIEKLYKKKIETKPV